MTTQDQQSMTDSYDESQTGTATAPVGEHAAPLDENAAPVGEHAAPLGEDAAPATAEPPVEPSVDAAAPSGAVPNGEVQDSVEPVEAVPATHSGEPRESSTDEVLFADEELADLRARWTSVQAAFVDDPKDCVQKADVLVSDLVEQLTAGFADARSRLEQQWARGEEASTEDLRVALMHYREFFDRLLAV
jgi:hypothetical protein